MPPGFRINVLEDAVAEGSFTPVIGAACSTLDHEGEPRHQLGDDIRAEASEMIPYLNEAERRYLDELIDCDKEMLALPPALPGTDALINLRVALFRLDRAAALTFKRAVETYNNRANKSCEFLWKRRTSSTGLSFPRLLGDWHVPLQYSPTKEALLKALDDAIRAAHAVSDVRNTTWKERGLGAEAIVANLQSFSTALSESDESLTLIDLVWIGNLLWHSLRFNLQYYPTSAELAFQLSLCTTAASGSARGMPPLLAQAAQAASQSIENIKRWFSFYAERRAESGFYRNLAAWLQKRFNDSSTTNNPCVDKGAPLPMVFTTNYDCEIEAALDRLECSYHVVMPVYLTWNKNHSETRTPKALWLTKTVKYDGRRLQQLPWEYAGNTEVSPTNIDATNPKQPRKQFVGPILVKLHGSPLEELPGPDEVGHIPAWVESIIKDDTLDSRYEHRVTITEGDYLSDLRREIPVWVQQALQARRRRLFFLGQSVSDWNIRLRLADHINWAGRNDNASQSEAAEADQGPETARYRRFAVNRSTGFFDVAFMDDLGIGQLLVDLEVVQKTVSAALY